jgi:CheY-like chemotaxis protein
MGENTRSLAPNACDALRIQLRSGARIIVVFLSNAYKEDSVWLPANWIEFKSEYDPVALCDLIAIVRPPLQVFLCHSTTDKPAVRQLYTFLVAEGFRPWLDEKDLIAGQDWELTIRNAVRTSQVAIVCLSRAAVSKTGFVQKEIRLALDVADEQPEGAIFLIPVKLENCDVPIRLAKWQWVDLWTPEGYQRLLHALKLRAKELAITVARGLSLAEVAQLTSWRPPPLRGTILIALHNPDLIRFVSRILDARGWTVVTAESPQQAVDVALMSRQTPSIALLDHTLPDTSGLAFGRKLREQSPSMAIIITSLNELTSEEADTCEENDFIVLMKPFLAAELIRILDQIRRRKVHGRSEITPMR